MKGVRTVFLSLFLLIGFSVDLRAAEPNQKCAAAELKAVRKKADAKIKCHRKAILKGVPTDPACLTAAEMEFSQSFGAAEAAGGCAVTGNVTAVEQMVDGFVNSVANAIPINTFPSCSGPDGACGECGTGICQVHNDPSLYPPQACVDLPNCVAQACKRDADCSDASKPICIMASSSSATSCCGPCQ